MPYSQVFIIIIGSSDAMRTNAIDTGMLEMLCGWLVPTCIVAMHALVCYVMLYYDDVVVW